MTRRRDCTCAGTAPGYPQHEYWCGLTEPCDDELLPGGEALCERTEATETAPFSERWGTFHHQPERPYEPVDEPVDYSPAVELHLVPTTGGPEQRPSMYACMAANGVPEEYRTAATAGASEWMKIWLRPKAEWLLPPADEPDPDGAA